MSFKTICTMIWDHEKKAAGALLAGDYTIYDWHKVQVGHLQALLWFD